MARMVKRKSPDEEITDLYLRADLKRAHADKLIIAKIMERNPNSINSVKDNLKAAGLWPEDNRISSVKWAPGMEPSPKKISKQEAELEMKQTEEAEEEGTN